MRRREFLQSLSAAALAGCQSWTPGPRMHVVVVGAGFGGATAAKYLRLWSNGAIAVTLVDPAAAFVSCPLSNLVVGGSRTLSEITQSYDGLTAHGVTRVQDTVTAVDPGKREVRLQQGRTLRYDRLVLSPGISFAHERIAGLTPDARAAMPHAWKAGWQTALLRKLLEAMPDGGVFVMAIPAAPYRCPPGPYERASQVAHYVKARKPRSKVILLDANAQIVSKGPLFSRVWKEDYAGIVEYRANAAVTEVEGRTRTLVTADGERVRADVANVIPPQRAGRLAIDSGLVTAGWCEVDWRTQESVKAPLVHVIGDATLSAPAMPKSGHMANQHGKCAAAAIVEIEAGRPPPAPLMVNTCYSFIDDRNAIRVSSVHQWVEGKRTLETVPGAGGVSGPDRAQWALEGHYAAGWARTIWADMLA